MERHVRWAPLGHEGLEYLVIRGQEGQFIVESVVVGEQQNIAFGLHYRLVIDRHWHLRSAILQTVGNDRPLILHSNGAGQWTDGGGARLTHFAGCIDIDISVTPFTNSLPIRRLGLAVGASQSIRVIHIPVPSLQPEVMEQRYTRLDEDCFLYENPLRNYAAELPVDADGLVIDYPDIFCRLP
jgi:hypothetical protein